jgi:hypothetical protein
MTDCVCTAKRLSPDLFPRRYTLYVWSPVILLRVIRSPVYRVVALKDTCHVRERLHIQYIREAVGIIFVSPGCLNHDAECSADRLSECPVSVPVDDVKLALSM